jgi:hypothetical protein
MDLPMKRIRGFALLAGVAIAFALIGIAVAPRSSGSLPSPELQPPGACTDLAREVDPTKVPVDSVYDPENDVVYAYYAGQTYVLRPDDPACTALAPARSVRAHAIDVHRQNMEVACDEIKRAVVAGPPVVRGRPIHKDAAQSFLTSRCGAARP